MVLIGRIEKQEGPFWSADVDAIGAHTQGTSVDDALDMLASLIRITVDRAGFAPSITQLGKADDGAILVYVTANEPALLASLVLKFQREVRGRSLADVAKKLGGSEHETYARYEQGAEELSIGKFTELLAAVAPDLVLTVGPRAAMKWPKRTRSNRSKASG
jgi:hypothetical protein